MTDPLDALRKLKLLEFRSSQVTALRDALFPLLTFLVVGLANLGTELHKKADK
jgi:hypothetical protein